MFGGHDNGFLGVGHTWDSILIGTGYSYGSSGPVVSVPFDSKDMNRYVHYCITYNNTVLKAYKNSNLIGQKTGL